jgi:HEAT repeat protein
MGYWSGQGILGGGRKMNTFRLIAVLILVFLSSSSIYADSPEDSIAVVVDDLFMKASSGEVQFRDLVEPAKKELIAMGEKAVPQMITKLKTEDARERHTVEDIFEGIGDPAVPYLIDALDTDNLYQLRLASNCLGLIGNKEATEPLLELFDYDNHTVRSAAVTAVGKIKDTTAVPEIISMLEDNAETVRKSAAVALGRIEDDDAIYALVRSLDDPHFSVRYSAMESLVKIGDESGKVLEDMFDELPQMAQYYAVDIWAGLKYEDAFDKLENLLKSPDQRLRGFAIVAIAKIKPGKTEKLVRRYSENEDNPFVLSSFEKARRIAAEETE